jgi:hypothetical protein
MQYMVTKYIFEDVPSWVEWFDVRPPSQINLPYEPLPADHPGSQDGSWPMDFPYDQQHIFETTSKEICIRIKEKAGNISTQPFRFGIYMMQNFPIIGGTATDPLDQNYLNFEYTATPVFNDPANDTSPGGDDGDDGGGADTGDGAPS